MLQTYVETIVPEEMADKLISVTESWGVKISTQKSEILRVTRFRMLIPCNKEQEIKEISMSLMNSKI